MLGLWTPRNIITKGLLLRLDSGIKESYPGSGVAWNNLNKGELDGTLLNGVAYNTGNGGTLVFDGINDYVDCGTSSGFNFLTELTVSCWFFLSENATYNQNIVDMWDWPQNKRAYAFGIEGQYITGNVSYDGLFGDRLVVRGATMQSVLNEWVSLTMTYDGQTLSVFKNGALEGSASFSQPRAIYYDPAITLWLMRARGNEDGRHINGKLAQVLIYNNALSPPEIKHNFNVNRKQFGI